MSANSAPEPKPDAQPDTGIQASSEPFPKGRLFADHSPPASPGRAPSSASRTFTRVILPMGILLAAVAGLAWVTQFRPGKQQLHVEAPIKPVEGKMAVEFRRYEPAYSGGILAVWDARQLIDPLNQVPKSHWLPEYELTGKGYYDFEFSNRSADAELGLFDVNCFCSEVKACVIPAHQWEAYQKTREENLKNVTAPPPADDFPWIALSANGPALLVPAGEHGVVRLHWKGRPNTEPGPFALRARIWTRPARSSNTDPTYVDLYARIAYVPPVRFHPTALSLGLLEPDKSSLPKFTYCWSATRDLTVEDLATDPCLVQTIEKLTKPEDIDKLTEELAKNHISTRIRSAYRIQVKAWESKDGKQRDLGAFRQPLAVKVSGDGEPLDVEMPMLRGVVGGDVKVAGSSDQNFKIDLANVKAKETSKRFNVELIVKPGMELEFDSFEPAGLGLKHKLEKPGTAGESRWKLEIQVHPILDLLPPGPLPDSSAVLLRVKGTPRKLRLPITGAVSR